jgi:hypothetical protein
MQIVAAQNITLRVSVSGYRQYLQVSCRNHSLAHNAMTDSLLVVFPSQ